MKFFKAIKTLEELKKEYKRLARVHHPDMGGELKVMQEINAEFDSVYDVLKNSVSVSASKAEEKAEETEETAEAFRSKFYTANGWAGSKYEEVRNLTTVEIAKLIRKDLKAEFPECKFSVTSHSASMCSEISVSLMESPYPAYMTAEEIKEARKDSSLWNDYSHPLNKHYNINVNGKYYNVNFMTNFTEQRGLTDEEFEAFCNTVNIPTEKMTAILKKADAIVNKYRYNDCDGMIDYFDTNFYYFDCSIGKEWRKDYICNPELAKKIKQKKVETSATTDVKEASSCAEETSEATVSVDSKEIAVTVKDDIDTRDNSEIKVIKPVERLSKEDFNALRNCFKVLGGYYSRFKGGFIFTSLPEEIRCGAEQAEKSIEADEDKPESSEAVLISEAAAIETSDKESSSEAFYVEQKNKIRKEQIKAKVSQILVRLAYEIYIGSCQARTKYHCRQ